MEIRVKVDSYAELITEELINLNKTYGADIKDNARAYIRLGCILDILLEYGIDYYTEEKTENGYKRVTKLYINRSRIDTRLSRYTKKALKRKIEGVLAFNIIMR